jgi:hypothetical protein
MTVKGTLILPVVAGALESRFEPQLHIADPQIFRYLAVVAITGVTKYFEPG